MKESIDRKRLFHLLESAPECKPVETVPFQGELSEYLFEKYLTPFLMEQTLHVSDLDFSQFTVEDVREFGRYLEVAGNTSNKLIAFCNAFAHAVPVALSNRTFC